MPEVSRFFGIVIGMFYKEHGVPHFHAVYGEHEISVEIESDLFTADSRRVRNAWSLNGQPCTGQNCSRIGRTRATASRCLRSLLSNKVGR